MTPAPDPISRVQTALDELARALGSGQAEAVLAAQPTLAAAVAALAALDRPAVSSFSRAEARRALQMARLSVIRCQRLGQSAAQLTRAAFPHLVYERSGDRGASQANQATLRSQA